MFAEHDLTVKCWRAVCKDDKHVTNQSERQHESRDLPGRLHLPRPVAAHQNPAEWFVTYMATIVITRKWFCFSIKDSWMWAVLRMLWELNTAEWLQLSRVISVTWWTSWLKVFEIKCCKSALSEGFIYVFMVKTQEISRLCCFVFTADYLPCQINLKGYISIDVTLFWFHFTASVKNF